MQDLKMLLEQNYLEHPAFQFSAPSWEITEAAQMAFNQRYKTAKRIAATLSDSAYDSLRQSCHIALSHVFTELNQQASDAFEHTFLSELQQQCAQLLDEELTWYRRKRQSKFVRALSVENEKNSMQLNQFRHFFGALSQTASAELVALAAYDKTRFLNNANAGKLKREDLSMNDGKTVRAIRDVLNHEFAQMGTLDVLSSYCGCRMRVGGLSLELSVPQATWWQHTLPSITQAPQTLYAHLDETLACPKSIVYLSEVHQNNGQTSCYPLAYEAMQLNPLQELIGRVVGNVGSSASSPLNSYYQKQYHQSMSSENFRRHFMRLPKELRFNSHLGWDVMPGGEFEAALFANEKTMLGTAGTFIVFDGARLFHRGGLITQGSRLALQVIFTPQKTFVQRLRNVLNRVVS